MRPWAWFLGIVCLFCLLSCLILLPLYGMILGFLLHTRMHGSFFCLFVFEYVKGAVSVTGDQKCHWFSQQVASDTVKSAQMLICQKYHFLFLPGGLVFIGIFWGSSVSPKILDAILLGLLEETAISGFLKRLLESLCGSFMTLMLDWLPLLSRPWNMSATAGYFILMELPDAIQTLTRVGGGKRWGF